MLLQEKIKTKKKEEIGMKQNYVSSLVFSSNEWLKNNFSLATLFSDIPCVTFNGKVDEIEAIKQTFEDFLKKVVVETSREQEHDERFV